MAAGAHRASRAVVLVPSRDAALPADSELRECPIPAVLILPSRDRDLRLRLAGQGAPRCQLFAFHASALTGWGQWTFFSTVILALLGIEVPLNMGVEIKSENSIKRYLFWGC